MQRKWGYLAIVVLVLAAISGVGAYIGSRAMSAQAEQKSEEPQEATEEKVRAEDLLAKMTLEQKVAQLFFINPEQITGVGVQTAAGDQTKEAMRLFPVGGFLFFAPNLEGPEQTREMLGNMNSFSQEISGVPVFLGVDEEGGMVTRVGGRDAFGIDDVGHMRDIGATEDVNQARAAATTVGRYLGELGFNVNFAPVADIANNPEATTMETRSFSSEESIVTAMVRAQVEGFNSTGILSCAKHFPGIGGAFGDSETGYIETSKSLDEMAAEELKPFRAAMEANVPFIMVGHISCPTVTGDEMPASLSKDIVTGVLRNNLGYKGIIITDALSMGAVSGLYDSSEIGVQALLAGNDMILQPSDFEAAYTGVITAVHDGRLSEERINESVLRVLEAKLSL